MNKPNKDDYVYETDYRYSLYPKWFDYDAYIKELEKYCNELENGLIRTCKELRIVYYATMTSPPFDNTEENWRKWALKDE